MTINSLTCSPLARIGVDWFEIMAMFDGWVIRNPLALFFCSASFSCTGASADVFDGPEQTKKRKEGRKGPPFSSLCCECGSLASLFEVLTGSRWS